MADLIIKISGDINDYESALADAESQTEGLGGKLETVAKSAGLAFAALAAEAALAIGAFANKERVTNQLTAALQNQGIYSKELLQDYQRQADALELLTGLDADAINSGQGRLQSMIGQIQITDDLSAAIADLAVGKLGGDLVGAYDIVGKAAAGNVAVLKRYGIEVEDSGDKAENLSRITAALSSQFGGQAEAAAKGTGGFVQLGRALGDVQEEIGQRLAPAAIFLTKAIVSLLDGLKNNKGLVDFVVAAGTGTAVVAGLALAVGLGGLAFLKLKAALLAAQIATSAMTVATRGLVAATGIGALVTIATLVALNWDEIWPRMQGVFQAFTTSVTELASGVGKVLRGVFTLDTGLIEAGFAQAAEAAGRGMQAYNTTVAAGLQEKADLEAAAEEEKQARNSTTATEEENAERAKAQRLLAIAAEKRGLIVAQLNQESEESIGLRQEEIALLEQIEDEKNAAIVGKLQERLARVRELQEIQKAQDLEQEKIFQSQILAGNEEFEALSDEQKAIFLEKNKAALQSQLLTETTALQQAALEKSKIQTKEHNDFLLNQQKFGTAYATINQIMNSAILQGSSKAFGDLAALQTSSNATLKGIGKAAAVANIAIQTAQAAMNIYSGFSTIPIIGPALGIAGAAAAVAFGVEQTGKVTSAAQGGLMTGGIPGVDSIPTMTMPGELVAPTRNFDEVVNAVADSRLAESGLASGGSGIGSSATIILQLKDDLMDFIEAKLVERTNLNLSIQGA